MKISTLFRYRQTSLPAGLIIINDFSQSREKLRNRVQAIVRQFRDGGLQEVFISTTVGEHYLNQIPVTSNARIASVSELPALLRSWIVLVSDQSFHVSGTLISGMLRDVQVRKCTLVTDYKDPLVYGMGLQIQMVVFNASVLEPILHAVEGNSCCFSTDPESLLLKAAIRFEKRSCTQEDILSCYREYSDKHPPRTITVETSTKCNYSCLMCPYHGTRQRKGSRYISADKQKDMELEKCIELIHEVCKWEDPFIDGLVKTIVPYRRGEPLLYPDFKKVAMEIKNAGAACFFATNASLLDEEMAEFIVDAEIDHIKVSMHGASPEVYGSITGRDLAPVVQKIRRLVSVRSSKGKRLPQIGVIFTVQDTNKQEADKYVKAWLDDVDYVALSPENRLDETVSSKKYQEDLLFFDISKCQRPPCRMLVDYAWVNASLDVVPCIGGFKENLGSVEEEPLRAVLNKSSFLKHLKGIHVNGTYSEYGSCRECQAWYGNIVKEEQVNGYRYSTSPVMKIIRRLS